MKTSEKGFVLIEFVIALPLIILLLYGLAQTTFTIFSNAKEQAANYVLEVEAQDILTRITQDLRAASYVERKKRFKQENNGLDIDTLTIKYHGASTFYYENNKKRYNDAKIFDIIDTRVYVVNNDYKLNAKRNDDGNYLNPISGGNFFGDTVIKQLNYDRLAQNVIHITLEIESISTNRRIKISTAVFMPVCKEMKNFE